jgi:hypothetical protein
VLQCKIGQYNTVHYNKIQHNNTEIIYNTECNPLYAKLQQKKNQEHMLYPI